MSHFRKDPIVNRWVIIAPNRAERPGAFIVSGRRPHSGICPFCEGRESFTPPEILAFREPGTPANGPGWRVRVVTNKYPALDGSEETSVAFRSAKVAPDARSFCGAKGDNTLYQSLPGVGVHDLLIESPRHLVSTADLSEQEVAEVFRAYRRRLLDLRGDPRLVHATVLKNVGEAAGASVEHAHSQIIVLPMVPTTVEEELSAALEFYAENGRCVFCELVRQEVESAERIVLDTPGFVAFCPFASRFAYETWVVPKTHASHFEAAEDAVLEQLAVAMKRVIGKIEAALDRPAYNYLIHTAPFDRSGLRHYHWHIEIAPVLTKTAGFELGSGYFINPVPPEDAARKLRIESKA